MRPISSSIISTSVITDTPIQIPSWPPYFGEELRGCVERRLDGSDNFVVDDIYFEADDVRQGSLSILVQITLKVSKFSIVSGKMYDVIFSCWFVPDVIDSQMESAGIIRRNIFSVDLKLEHNFEYSQSRVKACGGPVQVYFRGPP